VTPAARLPVEPERLHREFPALTHEDVEAYVQVTRRILDAAGGERPRVTREALEGGRRAREKAARGEPLDAGEALLARYLDALAKMQRKGPAREG
jgi:hypothetical protein